MSGEVKYLALMTKIILDLSILLTIDSNNSLALLFNGNKMSKNTYGNHG